VYTPVSLKDADVQAAFAAHSADIAVVAAYGLILPRAVLALPRLGCINIHASLLPRWRGAAPIQRAIMAGDTETGITIMQMEAGLDTGPMLIKGTVPIDDRTTAGELHDTLAQTGAALIVTALERLAAGNLPATPQPAEGVTHAAKIDKAEAAIDFTKPADVVLRHIHGLAPMPGAWFAHGPERIKVLRVERAPGSGLAGMVIGDDLTVACGSGAIRLLTLQRAGKSAADGAAFLRGYALPVGTQLA
jgi:methionyl-tRNA formyltransferase